MNLGENKINTIFRKKIIFKNRRVNTNGRRPEQEESYSAITEKIANIWDTKQPSLRRYILPRDGA